MTRVGLSPQEVAEALGFDVSTVYRLQKDGTIPFVVVGKSRRTSIKALEALLEPSSARPPEEAHPSDTAHGAG